MTQTVFTIVSRNYFAYARTLGDSLRQSNPTIEFNVLIVDRKDPSFEAQHPDWRITWVEDLEIADFVHVAFKYDILELNTNVKPTFAKRLLERHDKVIYLDPDIFVYDSLAPVLERLDRHPVVLTPHTTTPIDDDKLPGELEFLNSGIYNLGFAAFNNSPEARKLLDWWERRCLDLAYNDQPCGLFVDQKWMDFAPSLCPDVCVLRDKAFNVAYWNLHERTVHIIDGKPFIDAAPLVFFHFSGLPPRGDDRISKYQTRFSLSGRPDVAPLFGRYRETLEGNGHADYLKLPYGFGVFTDGAHISSLARRSIIEHQSFSSGFSPFDAGGPVYETLKRANIIAPASKGNARAWRQQRRTHKAAEDDDHRLPNLAPHIRSRPI
ncbi:MAG: glycosyltransferase [Comamonadaceae bacterium]|nr:glycosyltransferase [Comamonadaceae bacterium]